MYFKALSATSCFPLRCTLLQLWCCGSFLLATNCLCSSVFMTFYVKYVETEAWLAWLSCRLQVHQTHRTCKYARIMCWLILGLQCSLAWLVSYGTTSTFFYWTGLDSRKHDIAWLSPGLLNIGWCELLGKLCFTQAFSTQARYAGLVCFHWTKQPGTNPLHCVISYSMKVLRNQKRSNCTHDSVQTEWILSGRERSHCTLEGESG